MYGSGDVSKENVNEQTIELLELYISEFLYNISNTAMNRAKRRNPALVELNKEDLIYILKKGMITY